MISYPHNFEHVFKVMKYPAGESHVEANFIPSGEGNVIVAANVRTWEDLLNCVTANRILEHNGVTSEWFIPYFPFGRHDRRRNAKDGLELQLALELVKGLNVTTLDPHSDVLGQLRHIGQAAAVDQWIKSGLLDVPRPVFIIPDNGATKKANTWLKSHDSLQATKYRDPVTGRLSGAFVYNDILVNGKDCIIVDDICDGGGTFLALADVLKEAGAESLTLAVTHGLFTKGLAELNKFFSRIFVVGNAETGIYRIGYDQIFMENAHERY